MKLLGELSGKRRRLLWLDVLDVRRGWTRGMLETWVY